MDGTEQAAEADTGISDEQRAGDAAAVMHILLAHSLTAGHELDMTQEHRDKWAGFLQPHIDQITNSPRAAEITAGLEEFFDKQYLDTAAFKEKYGRTKRQRAR